MFDSGVTAKDLIDQIKDEADIALSLPDSSYLLWLNATEQLLYTEVIKEQKKQTVVYSGITNNEIDLSTLSHTSEGVMRFEDVYAVYADEKQLIKSTLTSGVIFPDTYFKSGNKLGLNVTDAPTNIIIVYYVKPELKTEENMNSKYVMLPVEFLELIKAKIRGEAYKAANEDALAAKWLNDYNVLVETFKAWLQNKQPEFGI